MIAFHPWNANKSLLLITFTILAASGQIDAARLAGHEFAGELSLSGALRPIRGALAMSLALHAQQVHTHLVLPPGSAEEAALVPGARVYRAHHLLDVVRHFLPLASDAAPPEPGPGWTVVQATPPVATAHHDDLSDVKGHTGAKRALEIAAAGGHSLLMLRSIDLLVSNYT